MNLRSAYVLQREAVILNSWLTTAGVLSHLIPVNRPTLMNKLGFALYILAILAAVCAIAVMYRRERPRPAERVRGIGLWWRERPRSDNLCNK